MISRRLLGALLPFFLLACRPAEPPTDTSAPPADPERVIATYGTQAIRAADVERFVGQQGLAGRLDPRLTSAERYGEVARRLAIEDLLLAAARGDEDPEAMSLDRHQRRLLYSEHYLRSLPAPEPLSEAALRRHFADAKPRLDRPEKRRVSHIFLRYGDERERQQVVSRLQEIRQQVVDGRPFELLARQHSESETRHRDGVVGFVERGVFPADFDRVVFALPPGVPSEVFSTADGAHLFFVHNVLEARDVAFEDVRQSLLRERQLEQRFERLRAAAADLPRPEGTTLVERDLIPGLLRAAPADLALLRTADARLTVGDLRQMLRPLARQLGDLTIDELPLRLFDELHDRETIFQHMLAREQAGEDLGLPQAQVDAVRRSQQIERFSRRKMIDRLEAQPQLLDRFRADNALRFSTPLRFEIERLSVPAEPGGSERMATLEKARDALDAGDTHLQQLAAEMGGRLDGLGLLTLAQLGAVDPAAVHFAPLLRSGEHSPPYVSGEALAMFAVRQRLEPEALPLEQVREQVIEEYLEHHGGRLFREIADEMLEAAGFELNLPAPAEASP